MDVNKKNKYFEKIDSFYKMKGEYDDKIKKKKSKILGDKKITMEEKKRQVRSITMEMKCIGCEKKGGTIFNVKRLQAFCGSENPNCKLAKTSSKRMREKIINIRDKDIELYEKMQKLKKEIILLKLDILFKHLDEGEALDKFEEKKKELVQTVKYLHKIRQEYLNIVDNEEKNINLENLNLSLSNEILNLKNIGRYLEDESEDKSSITESLVEQYCSTIKPLVQEIRAVKYGNDSINGETEKCYIESEVVRTKPNRDDEVLYTLIQEMITLNELCAHIKKNNK